MSKSWSRSQKRYLVRVAVAMAAYLVALSVAVRAVDHGGMTGALAYLLALLPGLSVAAIFWAEGRLLIEEADEYLRMLKVRQSLVATGFTLSLVTIWGFLENFRLVRHVDAFYIIVVWFIGLALGSLYNRLTLRASDGQA